MRKKRNVGTKIVVWWGGLVGRGSDRGGLWEDVMRLAFWCIGRCVLLRSLLGYGIVCRERSDVAQKKQIRSRARGVYRGGRRVAKEHQHKWEKGCGNDVWGLRALFLGCICHSRGKNRPLVRADRCRRTNIHWLAEYVCFREKLVRERWEGGRPTCRWDAECPTCVAGKCAYTPQPIRFGTAGQGYD